MGDFKITADLEMLLLDPPFLIQKFDVFSKLIKEQFMRRCRDASLDNKIGQIGLLTPPIEVRKGYTKS